MQVRLQVIAFSYLVVFLSGKAYTKEFEGEDKYHQYWVQDNWVKWKALQGADVCPLFLFFVHLDMCFPFVNFSGMDDTVLISLHLTSFFLCAFFSFSLKQKSGRDDDGEVQEITVYDYYVNNRHIELRYSADLPCINVGKPKRPTFFPLEVKLFDVVQFGCEYL